MENRTGTGSEPATSWSSDAAVQANSSETAGGRRPSAEFSESRKALSTFVRALPRETFGALAAAGRALVRPFRRRARIDEPQTGQFLVPEPAPVRRTRSVAVRLFAGFVTAILLWAVAIGAVMWWALRDVPWETIAQGGLTPVVLLEDASGDPLVQSGPFQGG
jgi:hypothetical protein